MNHFSELQSQHEELLRRENAGENILENVQTYIEDVRFKSSKVSSAQEREQLRANTRYWASYVYAQTTMFPNTELTPFSGEMLKETVTNKSPRKIMWSGIIIIVTLLCFSFLIHISTSAYPSYPSYPSYPYQFLPVVIDPYPSPSANPLTPTPVSMNTSRPTQTPVTPTSIPLSISVITSENVTQIQLLTVIDDHTASVLDIEFSPDGQQLVSSGADGTITLWHVNDGYPLLAMRISQEWLQQSVTYNTDGKQIATGGNGRLVTILNVADSVLFAQFSGHEGFVFGLDYTPDGLQLASGDGNGVLKIWNVYSGGMFSTTELGKSAILELDFNQTQDLLAVANLNDGFKLLSYPSLRPFCTVDNTSALTTAFANDGKSIVFGNKRGYLVRVDPNSRDCSILDMIQAHSGFVNSVALNSEGNIMVSGGADGVVFVMPGEISLTGHTDSVESVAINPQGTIIASASADGTIILWGIPSE